jgi:chromosome segregation ATPase
LSQDERSDVDDHVDSVYAKLCERNERIRSLNGAVAAFESEVEAQKREVEMSWMAKIQRVEELNRSTRVTDALLLSIHAVGADIANCERERQTARYDRARLDRQLSNLRRDQSNLDALKSALSVAKRKLRRRNRGIDAKERQLDSRRKEIAQLNAEVKRLKSQNRQFASSAEALEAKMREHEMENSILFEQIQDQAAELSVSILELAPTRRGNKSPSLEDELANSFLDA